VNVQAEWQEKAGRVAAVALLALLILGYLMPATGFFQAVPGDLADPRYNSVVLEHLYRVLTGYPAGLWNPDFYYPFQGMLAFSDNHLGSAAVYALARLAGLPREYAFDIWFIVGVLLNFGCALYVLRRLGLSTAGAALGAFVFAFGVPVPAQDTHAQLVYRFASPLAVLALWQTFEHRRLVGLAAVAVFTVWEFYCSIYLGLFLVYLLAALACALLLQARPLVWAQWRANFAAEPAATKLAASGALLVSMVGLGYLGGHYYLISQAYKLDEFRPLEVIKPMLPRIGSYFLADANPLLAWLGRGIWVPMRHEHQMFIGFGAAALVVAAAASAWRGASTNPRLVRAMLIALAVMFLGTLWTQEVSLYYLIAWMPGIKAIRGVSRIILVMLVPISVLVAIGADSILRMLRPGTRLAPAVLVGLVALVAIEPLAMEKQATPIKDWRARADAVKALLPTDVPRRAILLLRTGSKDLSEQIYTELDAMVVGQELGLPVLNGYSAFVPPGYRLGPCASARQRLMGYQLFTRVESVDDYARRLIVLDPGPCPDAAR